MSSYLAGSKTAWSSPAAEDMLKFWHESSPRKPLCCLCAELLQILWNDVVTVQYPDVQEVNNTRHGFYLYKVASKNMLKYLPG